MRRMLAAVLVVAAGFAVIVPAQMELDHLRSETTDELRYLPSERLLSHFTAGMSGVVADFLWIQCLQYTGRHYRGDHDFTWLQHMLTMVTRLDPYFVPAYRYGAIFLTMLKADDNAGLDLLHHGMVKNPFAWELPYEAAMTWLINRRDHPEAEIRAAQYLAMSVETGNAPEYVLETAVALQGRHDLTELERTMWENTRKTGNDMMRDIAERKLAELDIREACKVLTQASAEFERQHGAPPKNLEEMAAAGIINGIPADPFGGEFLMDPAGNVLNTTLLDQQVERSIRMLQSAVKEYQNRNGGWPASLEDLVTEQIIEFVPPHPYPNRRWEYDPASGVCS